MAAELFGKPSKTRKSQNLKETQQKNESTSQTTNSKSSLTNSVFIKSFEIKNATFHVYNISGPTEEKIASVKNMNLRISNIGINTDTKILFSTDIDINDADVKAKGQVTLAFLVNTDLEGRTWKNSIFNGQLNFDNLDINYRDAFVKKKLVPFNLAFSGVAKPQGLTINNFKLNLQSIDSKVNMSIKGFDKLDSDINLSVFSNNLSDLGDILPQHKDMLLNATLNFNAHIMGELSRPDSLLINLNTVSKLSNSDIDMTFIAHSLKPLVGSLKVQSKDLYLSDIVKPFMSKNPEETNKNAKTPNKASSSTKDESSKLNNETSKNKNEEF